MNQNFDWLVRESLYEPSPTLEPARPSPIPLGWKVFWTVVVIGFAVFVLVAASMGAG